MSLLTWNRPMAPWRPDTWQALVTVADYERCARGATPGARHVRVRAASNDPKMKPGEIEVRVRGPFRRRLSEVERSRVHEALVARHAIGVHLRVLS